MPVLAQTIRCQRRFGCKIVSPVAAVSSGVEFPIGEARRLGEGRASQSARMTDCLFRLHVAGDQGNRPDLAAAIAK